jgi:hypothetical protein
MNDSRIVPLEPNESNFHPHIHAIVPEGIFTDNGDNCFMLAQ